MSKKTKGWPELGIITKNAVKDKDGNIVKNSKGETEYRLGFKLNEGVTVLVDGEPIKLNEYRSGLLSTPVEEVEKLYKNGAITDETIEARREQAKEQHAWLRYKIVLPPPRA